MGKFVLKDCQPEIPENQDKVIEEVKKAKEKIKNQASNSIEMKVPEEDVALLHDLWNRGIDYWDFKMYQQQQLERFKPDTKKPELNKVGMSSRGDYPIYKEDLDMLEKSKPYVEKITLERNASGLNEENEKIMKSLEAKIKDNEESCEELTGPDTTETLKEIKLDDNSYMGVDEKTYKEISEYDNYEITVNKIKEIFTPGTRTTNTDDGTCKVDEPVNEILNTFPQETKMLQNDYSFNFDSILRKMKSTHDRKNSDYGDACHTGYKKYGDVYYLVQLHNKLTRLESLVLGNKKNLVDESIDDTLLDMANYAVLYLESRHRND